MLEFFAFVVVGMINPVTAGGGILAGVLLHRYRMWSLLILLGTFFVLVLFVALVTEILQSDRGSDYLLAQSCAALLWVSIAAGIDRLVRSKDQS